MNDCMIPLLGATVQHGPANDRIYLMKMGDADPERLLAKIEELAHRNGYSKIFTKIPAGQAELFLHNGYRQEAAIPGFFRGTEKALFLCRYPVKAREHDPMMVVLDDILTTALKHLNHGIQKPLPANAVLRPCREEDADAMASLYQNVFRSYPFPIHDPAYLTETMQHHVAYFGIEINGVLVALASAEMDPSEQNVEMTDFATHPDWRGHSFSAHLLATMEPAMHNRGFQTAYTIARAASLGMNITFARLGYQYGGRLINNTQIAGQIESMNIWHKPLIPAMEKTVASTQP